MAGITVLIFSNTKFFNMKKTLKDLVAKLQETADGKVNGGFGSIRGGREALVGVNSQNCVNEGTCSGTNENVCVNKFKCGDSTNKTRNCSNEFSCFAEP
jgi:hypothetical protein